MSKYARPPSIHVLVDTYPLARSLNAASIPSTSPCATSHLTLEILILKTLYPIHRNPLHPLGRMQKELGCVEVLEWKGGGEADEGVGGSWYFLSLLKCGLIPLQGLFSFSFPALEIGSGRGEGGCSIILPCDSMTLLYASLTLKS